MAPLRMLKIRVQIVLTVQPERSRMTKNKMMPVQIQKVVSEGKGHINR
ncbi:hypothetical protein HUSEC_28639 [Escherichia coli O104:H4 str. LB226692]|nr:hypothetical protein HUSEC_28639 [Escherichia coli O104:H4 str. LB226692]ESF01351.1 hypothetical protein SEEV1955_11792 [Salmonella enterica subsp. enterica serovar Virchow str. ATCC 51955]KAF0662332.1 hypothetical protein L247_30160 [Salmonella enterica subsp. enterica serovar Worthington str. BCH-7253]KAF0672651.1 hypothetical protein L245_11250 [Salmonella enterica subsp. enterica serovar Worthington str. BCH-4719]WJR86252.1 hypothetical protein XJ51_GM004705 [Escherichia coli]